MKNNCIIYSLFFLFSAFICHAKKTDPALEAKARKWSQSQPVTFLENKGQMTDMNGSPVPFVFFKASASGADMYLTAKGLTYVFIKSKGDENAKQDENGKEDGKQIEWSRVDMTLKDANIKQENIIQEEISSNFSNYFLAHCPDGITNVHSCKKITIKEIYPGIDWVLYNSNEQGFKYDFIVHPGADPQRIEMVYSSLNALNLDKENNILLKTRDGKFAEESPYSYIKETNENISSQFQIISEQKLEDHYQTTLGFKLKTLDFGLNTLVIDPKLVWATFYGGNNDDGFISIDCDAAGNVFGTGETISTNFPPLNPAGGSYYQGTAGSSWDAFILKFTNAGVLQWATYYGGSGEDTGNFTHLDASGNVLITGFTNSPNFPLQNLAGAYNQPSPGGNYDAFILKFDNNGVRLWATYCGGSATDWGHCIKTDAGGNLFITGFTGSSDFPLQNLAGAYNQPSIGGNRDAFISKFNSAGSLIWSTFYGGSGDEEGYSLAVDAANNLFVTGFTASSNFPFLTAGTFLQSTYGGGALQYGDAFILKFDYAGNRLWATYYGGSGDDGGRSIITTATGEVFVAGVTESSDFPLQNLAGAYNQPAVGGNYDAFILKFNNTGALQWATYYGGSNDEEMLIAHDNFSVDPCGRIYLSFETRSPNLTTLASCEGGYYNNVKSGPMDLFIARFQNTGALLWATYLGGDGKDFSPALATDSNGNLFCAGEWTLITNGASYPLTDPGSGASYDATFNGGSDDAFITKFGKTIPVLTTSVVNTSCGCTGSAYVNAINICTPSYLWSNGQSSQTASGLCAGTYTVAVTEQGCNVSTTTATVSISGGGGPAVTNSQVNSSCSGDCNGSINPTISGGSSPYTFSWDNGQTTQTATNLCAGTYSVIVSDANACTTSITFSVSASGGPSLSVVSQTSVACNGGNTGGAAINATGGTGSYTYAWMPSGGSSSASNGLSAGSYSVLVTDGSGCNSTQTISIPQPAVLTVACTSTPTPCTSSNGAAAAAVNGGTTGYTYNWSSTPLQTAQTATGLASGIYTVTVTDGNGCIQTATTVVTGTGGPVATAGVDQTIVAGNSATLSATGGGNYAWSNGTSTSVIVVSPTVTTLYCVTVSDANNCTDAACATVSVIVEPIDCPAAEKLYLPNAFSPNGDNENDALEIYFEYKICIKTFKLEIYDRWGEKVFETTDPDFKWNGTYTDNILSTQVFAYYLDAVLVTGDQIVRKGNISLLH